MENMKSTIAPLILLCLACLCGCCEYDVFRHAETRKFQAQFGENVPPDIFEKRPEFVDNGVFFIPSVSEMAWEPSHRSFIVFYAPCTTSIHVTHVLATSTNSPQPAVLDVDEEIPIATLDSKSGLFRGCLPTLYEEVEYADDVFSAEHVTITIEYRLKGDERTRAMSFDVERKRVKDIAWPT